MAQEMTNLPEYRVTMARLEQVKRESSTGVEYWHAREINEILGYPNWREFENVLSRARDAFRKNGVDPSHQIVLTHKLMGVGKGAKLRGDDYFLSRSACYLITMNGDPSKPEIAAAQAYFAVQTRRMEEQDAQSSDEKRLELRDKVAQSHKLVSGVAQEAGVRSAMQGVFHDARYQGLYGMNLKDVKRKKGIPEKLPLYDVAGPLELSANDFQMNLAAEVLKQENVKGEQSAIRTNKSVADRVRKAMKDSGATLPENLPIESPIKELKKRFGEQKKLARPIDPSI
ncbi:DNA damage-inducible protein D [Beijerinckiaceae bacterium]|nr:DNA damage-inducible protein D [Beijerinckiaceae bacterium]